MTTSIAPDLEQRFVMDDVDWGFYETVLEQLGDRHVFVTYDKGRLELMSPSYRHDRRAHLIGLLISVLGEELLIPIMGGGSTTFRRRDKETGLEPDQCFYVQHVDAIRGKDEIDLALDPPPDLAIEVEISRRMIKRIPLYAALGVPEVWRDDGKEVRAFQLDANGEYTPIQKSLAFPMILIADLTRLLKLSSTMDDIQWMRAVRKEIKEKLAS
jgi:Uma2 family endonuclease